MIILSKYGAGRVKAAPEPMLLAEEFLGRAGQCGLPKKGTVYLYNQGNTNGIRFRRRIRGK